MQNKRIELVYPDPPEDFQGDEPADAEAVAPGTRKPEEEFDPNTFTCNDFGGGGARFDDENIYWQNGVWRYVGE